MRTRNRWLKSALLPGLLVVVVMFGCGPDEDADNQDTNQVDTEFECTSTGTIEDDIDEDTTFSPDNNDCLVFTDSVKVRNGALLTIEAGVVLQFEENTGLDVDTGRLTAEGTAEDPVIMTGTEPQAGWWKGIQFRDTRSVDNKLDHVVIEYGGGEELSRTNGRANLVLNTQSGDPQVAIDNTTLQHGEAFGLYVENGSDIESFADNTLTANAEGAANITAREIGMLDDSSSFEGNDDDVVVVRGDDVGDGDDHVWPDVGVPYRVTDSFKVRSDSHVDVDAGVEIEFEENVDLDIDAGTFSAVGTDDDPVVLTGTEQQPGWWKGMQFRDTPSVDNVLEHVVIEYGGGGELSRTNGRANLVLNTQSGDPQVAIDNTTLQHGEAFGLYVENGSDIESFADNTLTANAEGAANITAREIGMLDDSSSFEGNDDDVVVVRGDDVGDGDDHVWPDVGVPYRVTDSFKIRNDSHVDVDAGVELEFEENVELDIDAGTFSANGESGDVIELRPSQEGSSTFWAGIQFRDTSSVDNRLEHVAIRGAARTEMSRTSLVAGLVLNTQSGDPEVALQDVEITDFGDEAAVGVEDGAVVSECSGMSGFDADDVIGDGADDFISACGL